jgi:hypothetical protein
MSTVAIIPTTRPPLWRVRREPVDAVTMPITGPWRVISPRGVEVLRTHRHRPALELAHSLAAIEEMLARVNRLERASWGDHPALKASARKRSHPGPSIQDLL